ncbi:hypothetical protein [uncultured Hydrogenophaga sp.]|uniref:hypothetical protein n=1 Tax=uncultured Hydrogenophaga sp. TaxID=199683 RepID=UPI00265FB54A|nr:hypothetical protein [uncultured Hydrogenophaga sp.]
MISLPMSFKNWWFARKPSDGDSTLAKARQAIRNTTLPLISPRRGRRILRREQLFTVIRESLIRGGVLSTSYSFKVLSTDANGDSFLVLIDLALGAKDLPDEYLLEIERWIQRSAQARHAMEVRSVYWRRRPAPDRVGTALRASVAAQTRRDADVVRDTAIPKPAQPERSPHGQPVTEAEVEAFRQALQVPAAQAFRQAKDTPVPPTDVVSDFAALSETQYGKL